MRFKIDTKEAQKRLKKYGKMEIPIYYQLQKWTGKTIKKIIRNISGPILNTRSGQLRRSITGKAFKGKIAKSIVGSGILGRRPVKYAKIHEHGGKITPKKAQFLTIPLGGVKGKASNFPGAFVIKSKQGNLLLVQKTGRGIKPLFLLRKEVNIPARHWLSDSIDQMKPELYKSLKPIEILKVLDKMRA